MKRLLALLLAAFCLLPSLFSCGKKEQPPLHKRTQVGLFDTVCTFFASGSEEEFDRIADELFKELALLDRLFDCYDKDGGLYAVNDAAGLNAVNADDLLIDFFLYVDDLPPALLEQVHPVMGALTLLWKRASEEGVAPTSEELNSASAHLSYDLLVLNQEDGTLFLTDPHARLDVGAFAKGYAAKVCAALLEEWGVEHYLLDLGGLLTAKGVNPQSAEPWLLGVSAPDGKSQTPLQSFFASDLTLSTTAGDKRYFVYEGEKYHHVIDPQTLYPAKKSGCLSVTVCSADPALADALSTALFILPQNEGLALISSLKSRDPSLSALFLKTDGTLFSTENFPAEAKKEKSESGLAPALILIGTLSLCCACLLLHRYKEKAAAFLRRHPLFFSKCNLLFLSIVLLCCLLLVLLPPLFKKENGVAVIRHQGRVVKVLPLDGDDEYLFSCPQGENLIVVKAGNVFVASSSCEGGQCVATPPLEGDGTHSVIACLPHRLTVTIEREVPTDE